MSDLSIIPLEDGFETQLAQDWNGAVGTVYVLDTPSYTPTTTNTYIVVNPGKTNMQIAEITDYDSTANTLTVSNVTLLKGLGINSTAPASSHATGSKVIISDNYQFWVDIQTAINSKLDDTGGTMTGLLQFSGTTHAGIKLLSLTTVQRDALSASNGMLIYNSTTGELNQYIGGAWSAVAAGSTQPTASTTVLGKIKTDVAPAGDPVALITDNPKYDALAGTSGTPSGSNKYVTNDDTASTSSASKLVRANASGKIDSTFINGLASKNFTLNENMTVGDVAWVDADGEINTWDGYKNSGDTVNAGATTYARSILIDTDKIVTFYYKGSGSTIYAKCGTISGDVITYGAEASTGSSGPNFGLAKVDTNAGCIFANYVAANTTYFATPFTVSGTTITFGTGVQVNSSVSSTVTTSPSICQISTNKVVFGYISGASANCNARIGSISANVLTLGTEYTNVFSDVHTHYTAVCKFDTDKFMISAQNGGSLKSTPCAVSGTTITPGSGINTTMLTSVIHGLTQVGTNQVLLLYSLGSAGMAKFVTVSGTTATGQTAYTIDASNNYSSDNAPRRLAISFDTDVFALGGFSNKMAFCRVNTSTYKIDVLESVDYLVAVDSGIAEYTTRKFFTTDNTNPGKTYILNNNARYIAGILQETGTAGQSKSVTLSGGVSTIHSALTPGEAYYVQLTGGIGLSNSLYSVANTNTAIKQIGRAISTTELNITLQ